MKPMIERTLEVQDENDGFQLIDLDNLSNNEMDLDAAFPSQVSKQIIFSLGVFFRLFGRPRSLT